MTAARRFRTKTLLPKLWELRVGPQAEMVSPRAETVHMEPSKNAPPFLGFYAKNGGGEGGRELADTFPFAIGVQGSVTERVGKQKSIS